MSVIKVIGIDLGKSVFHLIGHVHSGREVYRHKLNRVKLIQFISVWTAPSIMDNFHLSFGLSKIAGTDQ